ncbi:transport Sec24C-like protein [Dinothrombium tinctorium]|uniref:Transport Sec24C-like protein n=1 Tax=Dinothrombium tinctorium TaxID=1965070 RepID=A0A443QPZ1_9ACAR|nr:transport Sec24C-like protein [Dinothrombium tinctorium]
MYPISANYSSKANAFQQYPNAAVTSQPRAAFANNYYSNASQQHLSSNANASVNNHYPDQANDQSLYSWQQQQQQPPVNASTPPHSQQMQSQSSYGDQQSFGSHYGAQQMPPRSVLQQQQPQQQQPFLQHQPLAGQQFQYSQQMQPPPRPTLNAAPQQVDQHAPNQQHFPSQTSLQQSVNKPQLPSQIAGQYKYPPTSQPLTDQKMPPLSEQYLNQPQQFAGQQMPPTRFNERYPGQQMPHQSAGMPPQQPYYGSAGGMPPASSLPSQPPVQQQQRLDPDAMPSVVQVIEDDKAKFACEGNLIYATTIPASVPPMVTTLAGSENVTVEDHGCARPNHIRSTIYQVPITEDILKMTCVPLNIVVKPFDEDEIDGNLMIPVTQSEIIRCNRCKAYMSPFMRFIDGGRRFQCGLCRHITEVSTSYFAHLDHTGQRLDKFERPELYLGSYEFKATSEFCRNSILNCRRPHIIFAFEMTVNSKPVIQHISKNLSEIIRSYLPTDSANPGSPPPLVGFMTYDSKIQMYDIVNNGHAHIICDISSIFSPFTSFLVDPIEYIEQIESFLMSLPSLVPESELETETILGPVIEAALKTCQFDNSNWFAEQPGSESVQKDPTKVIPVGKVYLFHCTLPTYGQDGSTPGRLKPRWTTSPDDARHLLKTDKEKNVLTPETSKYYNDLAQRCVSDYGSGVELFLFPPAVGSFLDIATISELVRLTGTGGIYIYSAGSNWDISGRFTTDLKQSLKSSFAFDAIMKVRTSTGIRPIEYTGNFYARTPSDLECASINAGNSIVVELRYDDKLPEDDFLIIQVATLYTSVSGDRRVRIHNIAFAVCQQVADVFRNACCDTVMNSLLRKGVASLRIGEKTVQQVKESLISRTVSILAAYRRHCAQPGSSLGQLILPEALKLLPMYITGALKCDAIDGAGIGLSQVILYPKLLRIEYDTDESDTLRAIQIRCAAHRLDNDTGVAYLLENGFFMFLYIPTMRIPTNQNLFLKNLFGVENVQHINVDSELPEVFTSESRFIRELIEKIARERNRTTKLTIVRQGMDKVEIVFKSFLYEDQKVVSAVGKGDSAKYDAPNYVDLLCHLHKEIRAQLN